MSDNLDDDRFYMTTKDIARLFNRSEQTILNWRKKKPDFPKPAIKSCPNLYRRSDVITYQLTSCE